MQLIRSLLNNAGLLPANTPDALHVPGIDPWITRAEGLDRSLQPIEFAIALGHIAGHRGFRSNSKRDHGVNAPSETSKMLGAIEETRQKLGKYRTVGEMFALEPEFSVRKRNRNGDFSRSTLRSDLQQEVKTLLSRQRVLGNALATTELEEQFSHIAFSQRPLSDSWDKVGPCPFEPSEKRTAKRSPAFELFRFLARLTSLRVGSGRTYRSLSEAEIRSAAADFSSTKGMTFARLRKVAAIDADRFEGVSPDDERKRDVVTRSGSCAEGTHALRHCVGHSGWSILSSRPHVLDRIAEALTFFETPESIRKELSPNVGDGLRAQAAALG